MAATQRTPNEGIAAFNKDDYATALQEFEPLAANGEANAQYQLGIMYGYGLAVPQDYNQAVKPGDDLADLWRESPTLRSCAILRYRFL